MKPSAITPTIDLDAEGVQHGFLKLPYSRDDSAWGSVMIPLTVAKRGDGPTALLTGGNHGDEYEGPVALMNLAHDIRAEDVAGRIIILPAMNYPAFRSGRRTSPIDQGNLNRLFPGRPDGTVTEKIADYFQRYLLPMADYVLDIHSGGKTLEFLPMGVVHALDDKAQEAQCVAAMEAFGAPYSMMLLEIDSDGMYDTAAERMGKVFVSTELGGGGTAPASLTRIAERGVANFLRHAGILAGEAEQLPTVRLDMPGPESYISAGGDGLLEMKVNLGERVRIGDVVARVHNSTRTGTPPVEYRAEVEGILSGRHFPGLVQSGDCIAVIAAEPE